MNMDSADAEIQVLSLENPELLKVSINVKAWSNPEQSNMLHASPTNWNSAFLRSVALHKWRLDVA